MKINCSEQNLAFNALYMPDKKSLIKKVGPSYAEQLESVRGALENLAKDVDVFIEPKNATTHESSGFLVKVTELLKCPIKRLFGSDKGFVSGFVKISDCLDEKPLSDLLLKTVIDSKNSFLTYNQNPKY